jgi:uncharacterized protein involved in response to NO
MQHFLSYAFRPFFLLNGLFAMAVVAFWIMALHGVGPATLPADIVFWHGHEMLVGFAMAAIAGFILTAVATWTGRPPRQGMPLALLVFAWLAGRLAMFLSGVLPAVAVAVTDMLFPVLLVIYVAWEVFAAGNRRNYPIVLITVLLAMINLLFHLALTGEIRLSVGADRIALYLMINLVLLLITVIGGRIIPSFSANWLRARGSTVLPVTGGLTDKLAIMLTIATGLFASVLPVSRTTGALAIAAGLVHGYRLIRWRGYATWGEPLLFVLHAAYFWLPAGYLLLGFAIYSRFIPVTAALHVLTMGGIAFMIMAVSTRVALAHTGRKLHAARLTVFAYWILFLAVILRLLSVFSGPRYFVLIDASAVAWILAFGIFVWVYWPVLTGPAVKADS